MANQKTPVPSTNIDSKARTGLIFGAVGIFAAIIFGLLYLFVIAPSIPDGNFGWFLFSFATGLTMIVLPCTLPLAFVIVPLSMGKGMLKGLSMALAFGVGVAATLSLYGVAAALLGNIAIDALGGDLEIIKNWVYFIAGGFALIFALSEIGLLNIHMPTYSGAAPAFIQKRGEFFKAFLLGLFLGNVGVGCPHPATPLILIEIASSGDVLYGWLLFLIQAIGRLLPLLLLSFLAILGVNGLNWLLARKDAVERATGWAMVFVAGFILTLGLFSHDWWVNSGIHTGLEALTQEQTFNVLINDTLGTEVEHKHGLEEGEGLFGLPLKLGNWFLVAVWLVPIWWWYRKRKKEVHDGSTECDEKILTIKRNFLVVISIFLALTFIYFLPQNFYLKSVGDGGEGEDHASTPGHDESGGHTEETDEFAQYREYINNEPDKTILLIDESSATTPESADETENSSIDVIKEEEETISSSTEPTLVFFDDTKSVVSTEILQSGWSFEDGDLIKIRIITNSDAETDTVQTVHFHGQRMLVLSNNAEPNDNLEWQEVVELPYQGALDILVEMKSTGEWVMHGHRSNSQPFGSVIPFTVVANTEDDIIDPVPDSDTDTNNITEQSFNFGDNFSNENYSVEGFGSTPIAERVEEIKFNLKDKNGNAVSLQDETKDSLQVTFIDSTDTIVLKTFIGNEELETTDENHDDAEMPHASLFFNIAYADPGGHSTEESVTEQNGSYSVPVIFPIGGTYKAFVQFVPEGTTETITSSYEIEVRERTVTIDNLGWSDTKQWWILFVGSIMSIIPLVWIVRKYINVKKV